MSDTEESLRLLIKEKFKDLTIEQLKKILKLIEMIMNKKKKSQ